MLYDNFSKIDSFQNHTIEYLSGIDLKDVTTLSDKKFYVAMALTISVNSFSNDVVTINEPLKYVGEQQIIAQEQHLVKTVEAVNILRENWDLAILISRAEIKIKDYFGLTPLYLEAVGENELLLSIITEKSPKEALDKLHQFDNEWWIDNEELAKGKLCIDVVPT